MVNESRRKEDRESLVDFNYDNDAVVSLIHNHHESAIATAAADSSSGPSGNGPLHMNTNGDDITNGDDTTNDDTNDDTHGGGNASITSCVINLLNTVAGAGMLGLPGAYAGSGYISGTVLLLSASFFSAMGLRLLAISAATVRDRSYNLNNNKQSPAAGPASFYSVATAALPEFAIFIDAAVALKCFGVATGYFVTVGDCMVDAIHYLLRNFVWEELNKEEQIEEAVLSNRHFWVICAFFFVLPISFFKTLSALKFTSTLSLVLIYALAVGVVLYAQGVLDPCELSSSSLSLMADGGGGEPTTSTGTGTGTSASSYYNEMMEETTEYLLDQDNEDTTSCRGDTAFVTNFDSTVKNLAIFVFSFTCHQNVFSIVNELKNPTQTRVDITIAIAIGGALLLYFIVAVEGYRTFGEDVKGDILLNYPQTGLVTMMRVAIALMVILSYPLQLDPSRRCLTSLIGSIQRKLDNKKQAMQLAEQETAEDMLQDLTDDTFEDNIQNWESESPSVIGCHDRNTSTHSTTHSRQRQSREESSDRDLLEQMSADFMFNGITCSFLVFSFVIALAVSDLGVILGVVGATGSTIVSYILPGAIYIKLHPERNALKVMAYVQLFLGMIIVPTALYFVIFKGAVG